MLSMKIKAIFVAALLACVLGCTAQQVYRFQARFVDLIMSTDEAHRANKKRREQEEVYFMSLKTMFPDPQVRALAAAAGKGRIKKMEKLVAKGVDVNARGKKGAVPLAWALLNIEGFAKLLDLGADPNVIFQDGEKSVMHWAVKHEDISFLREALEHGGNPNLAFTSGSGLGETPLFTSVWHDKHAGLDRQMLLDAGADINAVTGLVEYYSFISPGVFGNKVLGGRTPLLYAADWSRYKVAYELLLLGADYQHKNHEGEDLAGVLMSRFETAELGYFDIQEKEYFEKIIVWLSERGVEMPDFEMCEIETLGGVPGYELCKVVMPDVAPE